MKIGLRGKFVIFFLIYSGILFAIQWKLFSSKGTESIENQNVEYLTRIKDIIVYELDINSEELERYGETQQKDARYWQLNNHLREIRKRAGTERIYIIYRPGTEEESRLFDTAKQGQMLGDTLTDEQVDMVLETYSEGQMQYTAEGEDDSDNKVISISFPLTDAADNPIAVLGMDMNVSSIRRQFNDELKDVGVLVLGLTAAGMVGLLLFVQLGIVRAIRNLKQSVQKMMEGEAGVEIPSRRRDEIGEIIRNFNRMSAVIESHMEKMEELNHAYQQFVPGEIFEILHRDNVEEVELGDQAQERMVILSVEAYAFEEETRELSSGETFLYINRVLNEIVPKVEEQGGIIMQFEKARVSAFYREQGKHAGQAAVRLALQSALLICERSKNKEFAAGIADGTVIVGIAGYSERMNIISISGEIKLSELLMQLAPKYGASVLISRQAREQIPDFENLYHARFLGYLKLSKQLVGVYDVFDSDRPEERRLKQMTKEQFEQGVSLFEAGSYMEARQAFVGVLRQYRADEVAKAYIHRCGDMLQEGKMAGEVWLEAL